MRIGPIFLALATTLTPAWGQDKPTGPSDPKAQKTYREGLDYLRQHNYELAFDDFKKADKQNGGHCRDCQLKIIKYGLALHEWKPLEAAAQEMIAEAQTPKEVGEAHYEFGLALMGEGVDRHKDELLRQAPAEIAKAREAFPDSPQVILTQGRALALAKQDDAAKECFQRFTELTKEDDPERARALRYIAQPDLARARMAPPFEVTTVNGQHLSLDELQGKVVLLDFWATWCGPCRAALPHVKEIAKKFEGEPLVVLSVSLDSDERQWKEFIEKNGMVWPQYFDGGFGGRVAKLFGVQSIPNTFTIDADGVLLEEHVGDAAIDGKLKKLVNIARARQEAVVKAQ